MSKPIELNKHQGGSYLRDPKTGELTLVAQTKHRDITGFEDEAVKKGGLTSAVQETQPKASSKKDAK